MSTSLSSVPAQTGKYLENWKLNLGISIASLTLSTVVLILVLVKQSYPPLNTLEEATRNPSTLEPVCLDCVQVVTYSQPPYLTETLFNQLRIHIKDGHKQCCFNSTDLIRILVELVAKNKDRDSMFLGNTSNLNFAVNNLPNECSHGLTVTQNSLIIKFSGHYYIYCSIRFRQTDINSPTKSYASFLHRINSGEPERTGVLLKSVITGLKSSKDTTFMGGVFFLREHDIIQVVVTDSDSVDYKSESTFIGLFLLASRRTLMPG